MRGDDNEDDVKPQLEESGVKAMELLINPDGTRGQNVERPTLGGKCEDLITIQRAAHF